MFKKKNGEKLINIGEIVLKDDVYDEFRYFANDGKDQTRYRNFRVSNALLQVARDEVAIVVNRLNPNDVKVLRPGTHFITRFYKYIYVPQPNGPMIVDFKPNNDVDKKNNFTFTPGLVDDGEEKEGLTQDEIFIDYKVEFKWDSVLQYYYSSNVMFNIQAAIVSLLRDFVATKSRKELLSKSNSFNLNDIDPNGKLSNLCESYGLRVVSFGTNNIKLSDAVQKAKNNAAVQIEEAKARKKTAEIDRETAKINAEASMAGHEAVFDLAHKYNLDPTDPRVMKLQEYYTQREIAKNAKNVILTVGSPGYIDPRAQAMLHGGVACKSLFDDEEDINTDEMEDNNVKGRKR